MELCLRQWAGGVRRASAHPGLKRGDFGAQLHLLGDAETHATLKQRRFGCSPRATKRPAVNTYVTGGLGRGESAMCYKCAVTLNNNTKDADTNVNVERKVHERRDPPPRRSPGGGGVTSAR